MLGAEGEIDRYTAVALKPGVFAGVKAPGFKQSKV
jgi:hypothetical protein